LRPHHPTAADPRLQNPPQAASPPQYTAQAATRHPNPNQGPICHPPPGFSAQVTGVQPPPHPTNPRPLHTSFQSGVNQPNMNKPQQSFRFPGPLTTSGRRPSAKRGRSASTASPSFSESQATHSASPVFAATGGFRPPAWELPQLSVKQLQEFYVNNQRFMNNFNSDQSRSSSYPPMNAQ
jgi:hypothetical protein